MNPIVFLGPSLARSAACPLLDADYRGPAAAGDILAAARTKPSALVLIDGYFARVPAVWHKEILYALEQGIRVYGAASMGALRAAEMHEFGMVGVGSVFERFRDGEFEDDDEVAVIHAPEMFGFIALSDAMVNVRDGLALALAERLIDAAEAATLVACAKTLFYPQRTWARVETAGIAAGLDAARLARLTTWAGERQPNTKRDDALAVLSRVRDDLAAQTSPPRANFIFERTLFWEQLVDSIGGLVDTEGTTPAVTSWAKLHGPAAHWRGAMLRHLLRLEARRRGWRTQASPLIEAVADLRRDKGLTAASEVSEWMAARDLTDTALARIVKDDMLGTELAAADARAIEHAFVDELKTNAPWAELAHEAAQQTAAAQSHGSPAPLPQDVGILEADLLAWYERNFRPITGDIERHARALGFQNSTEFLVAVVRAYLAATTKV